MEIKVFVEKYNKNNSVLDDAMNETLYTPYEYKMLKSNMIVAQACHTEDGKIKISRAHINLLFNKMLIESYTKLEFSNDGKEFFDEYNLLDQNGIVEEIIDHIPHREFSMYEDMVWDAFEDMIDNEKYKDTFGSILENLGSVLEALPSDLLNNQIAGGEV